jgi:hypothetical protein
MMEKYMAQCEINAKGTVRWVQRVVTGKQTPATYILVASAATAAGKVLN